MRMCIVLDESDVHRLKDKVRTYQRLARVFRVGFDLRSRRHERSTNL